MSQPTTQLHTPAAEVEINETLIRQLLQAQHPDLADLPIELMGSGWDNVMYRLGADYTIRLPRRQVAVALLENEQKWLPLFAPRLPIAVPVPLRIGKPQFNYPWPWSILEWQEGKTANIDLPSKGQGKAMAAFLKALHTPAPMDAPVNEYRGIPLVNRQEGIEERLAQLRKQTACITPRIDKLWQAALAVPHSRDKRWIHGDLHGRNVLVNDGIITCILDWGDMTSGDVASDLVAIWTLFDTFEERQAFIEHYQASAALLARAKGWAIYFGAVLLANGLVDNPEHAEMGRAVFRRLEKDTLP